MLPWFCGSAVWAMLSQVYLSAFSVSARTRQSKDGLIHTSYSCGAGCNESFSLPKCTLNFREAGVGYIRHKPLHSFQESESEGAQVSWGLDLESTDTEFYLWKQVTRPSHSQRDGETHSIFRCEEQQRNVRSFWIFPEHVFQIPSEGWQLQRCKREQTQWYRMEA